MAFNAPRGGATALRLAASEFLAYAGPMCLDSGHYSRAVDLARAVFADPTATVAGLSSFQRPTPTTKPARGVAVLQLAGLLTARASVFSMLGIGTSLQLFGTQFTTVLDDPAIDAIVVLVDSPGGEIGLVPESAALLRRGRAIKPVRAVVTGLNASAAYWISANASVIDATPSAEIGAIGVYSVRASIARLLDRDGVDVEVFSAGRFKSEGLPVLAVTEAERHAATARVHEAYGNFLNDVAEGRHVSAASVRAGFGEGRIVSAREALRLGMIDHVATFDDSIAQAMSRSRRPMAASAVDTDSLRERLERF